MARMLLLFMSLFATGCEITATVYVQKDWNTDPSTYANNDMVTKAEITLLKKQFGEKHDCLTPPK